MFHNFTIFWIAPIISALDDAPEQAIRVGVLRKKKRRKLDGEAFP